MSNQQFPRTYLINLKRSPERLEFMAEQLQKLGIPFEVIEAVDAKAHPIEELYKECDLEKMKVHNNGNMLSAGEIGCALSHRIAIKHIIENNLPFGLILEDDVELSPLFKKAIEQEVTKSVSGKADWEYVAFNYPSVGWKSIALWLFLFYHLALKNKNKFSFWLKLPIYVAKFIVNSIIFSCEGLREFVYKKIFAVGRPSSFVRPLYLAGAYLITQAGAKKLLTAAEKITYPADRIQNVTRVTQKLKHKAFVPLLARQKRETFASALGNDHFGKKVISY